MSALSPRHKASAQRAADVAFLASVFSSLMSPGEIADGRLPGLFDLCVGRVIRKEMDRGEDWSGGGRRGAMHHILDWLRAALVNGDPWLENLDAYGRQKKLMKFGTFPAILAEADRAMARAARKAASGRLSDGDEILHAELEDGFRLVRLMTPAALDRESAEMQHCIGSGAYDESLLDGEFVYLSLRDGHGKAHATLELAERQLVQLQGKQNRTPVDEYCVRLAPYLREAGIDPGSRATRLGYVVDAGGRWHPLDALPDGLEIADDLHLHSAKLDSLPKDMKVGGDLFLSGSPLTELPEGLSVGGALYIQDSQIAILPRGLSARSIFTRGSKISALPEGLNIGHVIDLDGIDIRTLPDSVADDVKVYINHSVMTAAMFRERHLPDGVYRRPTSTMIRPQVIVLPPMP